ncbi:Chemotaxis protein methyltransferase [Sulfitobacter sp. DSM 110093]|uniref:CheR family methyltransferase n=1 Tax=Sulfitobacter sp. DSM 110093 TaxID=2883127 RepID=UPI001FADB71F|nr:CheR family methyltransferase [Sulfitobacter sp. DSM 110093]UOA32890.1 Chemotaxis protein methyltransferase [Sulfitobacter sp. DSM 110093]
MDKGAKADTAQKPLSQEDGPPVIGIGASAGGLEALRDMLAPAKLPTGMAYVVVQHLDPHHESLLAELLGRQTTLSVRQAEEGEMVMADNVYIIPPGHGLSIHDGKLSLKAFEEPRGLRRPIDDFFMSLSEDAGRLSACVILSGTGADGTLGLRAIKEHGGLALVQTPRSARYDGMPLSAVSTGMVDFVLRPEDMLDRLRDYFSRAIGEMGAVVGDSDQIDAICQTLRSQTGHDFSGYKHTTLARRIQRRMQVLQLSDPVDYRKKVRDDDTEAAALLRDLLINVTRFFRDPEHFETLRKHVIAPLVKRAAAHQEIRVWVPGCSSGEEAYTLAMLFDDEALRQDAPPRVSIFATDIDEQMLEIAREARYLASALNDIPEEFRERYTIQHGDHFRIAPAIRDMVRISPHSVIKDPPFSRLSLVCCRNLLIYFGEELQSQVLPTFHYALRPDGFLFLGPSETIGRSEELFTAIDHKARVFSRNEGEARYSVQLPFSTDRRTRQLHGKFSGERGGATTGRSLALERLASRYARPCVVLDSNGMIIESHGRLGRYFEFSAGANLSASQTARPGLREVLLPLMRRANADRQRMVARNIEVRAEFGRQKIDVVADPLADDTVLMVFRDLAAFEVEPDDDLLELGPADGQIEMLEGELQHIRRQLRDKTEELETANEELKSSNEEMMSMNEELQSTNEELSTVNDELKEKVDQLSVANDDLRNFFESTQLPMVVLDSNMCLRSHTDAALEIFPLQPGDLGRPLQQLTSLLSSDAHLTAAARVNDGEKALRQSMMHADGSRQWILMVYPYYLRDDKQDGVTLIFTDVTEMTDLRAELDREREQLELAVQLAGIGIWEYNPKADRIVVDECQAALLELPKAGGHPAPEFFEQVLDEDRTGLRETLRKCAEGAEEVSTEFRVPVPGEDRPRWLRCLARPLAAENQNRVLGVSFDMTSDRHLAENRELMIGEMNHRVKNLFAVINALVATMARDAVSTEQFVRDLREKIAGLGRAHALTNRPDKVQGVTLESLVKAVLKPFLPHFDVTLTGCDIVLEQSEVTPLALIFHEWSTNAAKYGVLGADSGELRITCETNEDDGWALYWQEMREDRLKADVDPSGFGSNMLRIAAQQLNAKLENHAADKMFEWSLKRPGKKGT